jgi:plasmid stabilization system protein ParE
MAKVIRTSAAKDDLADIWSYIAQDNVTVADKRYGSRQAAPAD